MNLQELVDELAMCLQFAVDREAVEGSPSRQMTPQAFVETWNKVWPTLDDWKQAAQRAGWQRAGDGRRHHNRIDER